MGAKSKNHTSHNQGYKNHRNGIFKVKRQKYVSNDMVNQKLSRNTRRARKFDPSIKKTVNITKKIAVRRTLKQKVLDRIKQIRISKIVKVDKKPKKADKKQEAPKKKKKKKGPKKKKKKKKKKK